MQFSKLIDCAFHVVAAKCDDRDIQLLLETSERETLLRQRDATISLFGIVAVDQQYMSPDSRVGPDIRWRSLDLSAWKPSGALTNFSFDEGTALLSTEQISGPGEMSFDSWRLHCASTEVEQHFAWKRLPRLAGKAAASWLITSLVLGTIAIVLLPLPQEFFICCTSGKTGAEGCWSKAGNRLICLPVRYSGHAIYTRARGGCFPLSQELIAACRPGHRDAVA